jgi:predicted ester cyclase
MASETTTGSNIEIVREYTERVFNQHSPDLAAKYLAPGVTGHSQILGTIEGADNVTGMLRGVIGVLPDLHAAERDIAAAGDTVAVCYVVEATHEGNLLGITPTGRRAGWDAIDIYRLAEGMIVEEWAADDTTAILYQVGTYTQPWLAASRPTDGAS